MCAKHWIQLRKTQGTAGCPTKEPTEGPLPKSRTNPWRAKTAMWSGPLFLGSGTPWQTLMIVLRYCKWPTFRVFRELYMLFQIRPSFLKFRCFAKRLFSMLRCDSMAPHGQRMYDHCLCCARPHRYQSNWELEDPKNTSTQLWALMVLDVFGCFECRWVALLEEPRKT